MQITNKMLQHRLLELLVHHLANPYACLSAGISSLWGKSHGGANEAVIDMIDEITKMI